jgi:L-rhamnose mutarotase
VQEISIAISSATNTTVIPSTQNSLPTSSSQTASLPAVAQQQSVKIWNKNEERLLISLYAERKKDFKSCKRHESIWQDISVALNKKGIVATSTQTKNKWNNLLKTYCEDIDSQNRTGDVRSKCPHYKELDDIFGKDSNVRPEKTVDSLPGPSTCSNSTSIEPAENPPRTAKKPQKRKLVNELDALKEQGKQLQEQLQQHHVEKMARLDRFLDIFEKK